MKVTGADFRFRGLCRELVIEARLRHDRHGEVAAYRPGFEWFGTGRDWDPAGMALAEGIEVDQLTRLAEISSVYHRAVLIPPDAPATALLIPVAVEQEIRAIAAHLATVQGRTAMA